MAGSHSNSNTAPTKAKRYTLINRPSRQNIKMAMLRIQNILPYAMLLLAANVFNFYGQVASDSVVVPVNPPGVSMSSK